jgi:hypothetical protein
MFDHGETGSQLRLFQFLSHTLQKYPLSVIKTYKIANVIGLCNYKYCCVYKMSAILNVQT